MSDRAVRRIDHAEEAHHYGMIHGPGREVTAAEMVTAGRGRAVAITVRLRRQCADDLFGGSSAHDLDGIDMEASIDAYEAAVTAAIGERWPTATVTVVPAAAGRAAISVTCDDATQEERIEEAIAAIGEAVYDDGARWLVQANEAP